MLSIYEILLDLVLQKLVKIFVVCYIKDLRLQFKFIIIVHAICSKISLKMAVQLARNMQMEL